MKLESETWYQKSSREFSSSWFIRSRIGVDRSFARFLVAGTIDARTQEKLLNFLTGKFPLDKKFLVDHHFYV